MFKFEEVFSLKNLLEAHKKARCCKRHKNDVVSFELNFKRNINALYNDLKNDTYTIKGYNRFMIYDPKEREIQALNYRDRLVQNNLCYKFLIPMYNKKFIYDNCACQKGKGTHFARARLEKFLHEFYKKNKLNGYILKLDVKKYFNSINHSVLKQKLGVIYDQRLKKLVYDVIDSYSFDSDCGLPMGNQSSQIFALLYLNCVDRLIKEKYRIKYYIRYMDDLIIVHEDKTLLKQLFDDIKKEVVGLKLELNKKSEILALKNGVEFLGVKYLLLPNGKLLKHMKKQSVLRMVKRIKELVASIRLAILSPFELKMSVAGFWGNVKRLTINDAVFSHLSELTCLAS